MFGRPPYRRRNAGDAGFILIFVIGVCLTLAMVAVTADRTVRANLRSVTAAMQSARAEALADGGAHMAAARLLRAAAADTARLASAEQPFLACRVAGVGTITVDVEDEDGKVGINTGNDALLMALFLGLGAERDEAQAYVAAIGDFRDGDDTRRDDGAERDDYAAAGLGRAPKNADFETVAELDRVLGIPGSVRAAARPWLSADTAANGVDTDAAPPGLVDILVRGSELSPAGGVSGFSGGAQRLPRSLTARSRRAVFSVRAAATLDNGVRFVREAVVVLKPFGGDNGEWRQWRQGEWREKPRATDPSTGTMPAC